MRIERLRLLRYGSLADRTLDFRSDAAVHIVYGANEAGKSSALSALSDLLFGFEHAKSFDFLHEAANLRIGATLRAGDGQTLAFRRRRGAKNTLLADTDREEALRDDALLPFLGGLTRPVFERAFGLNSARLRRGSDEMLSAGGEMGAMLFAASSGILGLSAVRARLDEDAAAIFTPRKSSSRTFYQLLERHENARRAERDSELRAGDWKALNQTIDDLQEQYDAKARQRADIRKQQQQIDSSLRLQPVLAEIDAEMEDLESFRDLDPMPPDLGEKLASALSRIATADDALQRATTAHDRAQRDVARITLYPDHHRQAQSILDLFEERGAYQKSCADLPRITAERDDYRARLAEIARRLGIASEALDHAHPPDAVLARVAEALKMAHAAEARVSNIESRIEEERAALDRLDDGLAATPAIDPRPWRERLTALEPELKQIAAREEARGALSAERRRIAAEAARLDPHIDDLSRFTAAPLPGAQSLIAHREAIAACERQAATLNAKAKELHERARRADEEIAAQESGALPTATAISGARDNRDRAFSELADVVVGRAPALSPSAAADSVQRVEALTRTADILADAAIRDADAVSAHMLRLKERASLEAALTETTLDLATANAAHETAKEAYREVFQRLGVTPHAPDNMIAWLGELAKLLQSDAKADLAQDNLDAIDRLESDLRPALEGIGAGLGLADCERLPSAALARAISERLRQAEAVWDESRTVEVRRREGKARLAKLEKELGEAALGHATAIGTLREQAPAIGLAADARASEIEAALAAWKEAPPIRAQEQNRDGRVQGMHRDIQAFERKVAATVASLAPELAHLSSAEAIRELHEKSMEARTAAEQDKTARAALAEAQEALAQAAASRDEAASHLDAVFAGYEKPNDPKALAARLTARDRHRASLDACRLRFRQIEPGVDETAARTALIGFDRTEALVKIDGLRGDEARLDGELNELYASLARQKQKRAALGDSEGAETAAFDRKAIEAETVELARQWAVLRLASSLIGAAIERQRRASADPMLEAAGRFFQALTAGGFSGLSKRFNAADAAELVGVRANGEEVAIGGLSDGTRDQLYLALRLAYLEDYARRSESAPFIADDLFQTFDDGRTAAAMGCLAGASLAFQSIVFTHHRSVVDIAEKTLGKRAGIIDLT